MSQPIELRYTEDRPGWKRVIETYHESNDIVRRLDEIETSRQSDLFIGVTLKDSDKNAFCIGLAETGWALLFFDRSGSYRMFSLGNSSIQGDIEFRFHQWEVFDSKYLVRKDLAKNVIQEWCKNGQLSDLVDWEKESLPFAK